MRTIAAVAALLLLQAGCRWTPGQTLRPPGKIRPPGETKGTPQTTQLGRKMVSSKESPNRLTAVDGTTCIVAEKQFQEVVVGTEVTCLWART